MTERPLIETNGDPIASSKIGVLFLHHDASAVAASNLDSIRRHNPDAYIATISPGESFPGGYSPEATPELLDRYNIAPKDSNDFLVCSWFLQNKEYCDKWWLVEWDVYCTMSIREYYRPVWNFPFIASAVYRRTREPEWSWFRFVKLFPEKCKRFAIGAVPFLYLLSNEALEAACRYIIDEGLIAGNNELRFATAAKKCGYAPCGFSPPRDHISWMQVPLRRMGKGIYHPIKYIIDDSKEVII